MRIRPFPLLISLPILALPLASVAQTARAQDFSPAQATEQLSRAAAIDGKCRYLSEADHDELSDYVAKAEVVVARADGAETASSAVRTGKLAGEQTNCEPESERLVKETLDAGRRAMQAAMAQPPAKQAKRQENRNQAQILGAMADDQQTQSLTDPARSGNSLARYRNEATAYYLELRCRSLSNRQVRDFWKRIVARHESMIAAYGPASVVRARVEAERLAQRRSCGGGSGSFIASAYSNMR